MPISHVDSGADVRRIVISGRLDMAGTKELAPELANLIATPKKRVIVDLSELKFLASIGIRALIESAKVVLQRGGRMVVVIDGKSTVNMSLQATGIDELIPIFKSVSEAERALLD